MCHTMITTCKGSSFEYSEFSSISHEGKKCVFHVVLIYNPCLQVFYMNTLMYIWPPLRIKLHEVLRLMGQT
ncbi:hypothetical protein XENTR_v10000641 [Xenopus tropicalis]|nr:hypothetical protein XENTR_v10000641 [Xenopus tropicalis]